MSVPHSSSPTSSLPWRGCLWPRGNRPVTLGLFQLKRSWQDPEKADKISTFRNDGHDAHTHVVRKQSQSLPPSQLTGAFKSFQSNPTQWVKPLHSGILRPRYVPSSKRPGLATLSNVIPPTSRLCFCLTHSPLEGICMYFLHCAPPWPEHQLLGGRSVSLCGT